MADPVFEQPGEGGVVHNPVGGEVIFKVRGEQADGKLTAFETVVAPREGPPLHVHGDEDETLYVLEGEVRFKLGDELYVGGPGAFAFVPRGTSHTFQNVGDALRPGCSSISAHRVWSASSRPSPRWRSPIPARSRGSARRSE